MTMDSEPQTPRLESSLASLSPATASPGPVTVVGIGASAGGIRALQTFFAALPPRPGLVFVIVMHLSPIHESALSQVLQPTTAMPVQQVTARVRMEPDHVYVIPPNQQMEITDGHLILTAFAEPRWQRAPIDVLFRTLAAHHPDSIGILLSGGGTDGTLGMKALKEQGGVLMVQSPEEAEHATMPRSAIDTGLVDFILPAAALATKLLELCQLPPLATRHEPLAKGEADVVRLILTRLQASTGHDFSGYKPLTVRRRLERRMRVVQVESLSAYHDYLQQTPLEAQALFKDLLISVTAFFRDAEAFEALRTQVIPGLLVGKTPDEEVRVWVPGCATGEEAYSLAMLLLEQAASLVAPPRIQIFASDLDEDALLYARNGLYPEALAHDVSVPRLQRFFLQEGAYYRVRKELRDLILFTPHNLLKDPPFLRLDLISCRNLLIYLQRDLQERVVELFHYALQPGGSLFVGSAENLESLTSLFRIVDRTHCLYSRALTPELARLPALPLAVPAPGRIAPLRPRLLSMQQEALDAKLHRQMLEAYAPPSLLVDADATIVHVSETANRYLRFPSGSPSPNLYRAALPELRLELRMALYRAMEKHEATLSAPVPVTIEGTRHLVQLYITPTTRAPALALVVFLEASDLASGEARQAPTAGEGEPRLQQMEEALEALKVQMQSTIELSETQQEELKATNEELQSINEEYKSTLEELETSKEELQSTNEELTTVNQELQVRLQDLSQVNTSLHNLMAATEVGILFVDCQLKIQLYTPPMAELFNLLPIDHGRLLSHVTHRLGATPFLQDIQQTLETRSPHLREVQRDDGRFYLMRLAPYNTLAGELAGVVLTFVDITSLKQIEQQLREHEEQFRALVDTSAQIVWTMDAAGLSVEASPSWQAFTGQTSAERQGWGWLDAVHPADRLLARTTWQQAIATGQPMDTEFRLRHVSGTWRWTTVRAVPLRNAAGTVRGWVGMNIDITLHKQAEESQQTLFMTLEQRVADLQHAQEALRHETSERERMQEQLFQQEKLAALGVILANVAHELNNPLAIASLQLDNMQADYESRGGREDIETLRQAIARCQSVVQSFLALVRQQPPQRQAVALPAILGDVLVLLGHGLEVDDITLESHQAADLPLLWADPHQLHHVVANLISNAQHALRESAPPRSLTLTMTAAADRHYVRLRVADNGPGIPEALQRRIFEPFFTTKSQGMGSGLGLPMCRNIVEGHGGTLQLSSQPGHGTTVDVTLPAVASEPPVVTGPVAVGPAAAEPVARPQCGTILLIDDEVGLQQALQRLLQRDGHTVVSASNGREGLAALAEGTYEVILCDMRMPDLDGVGLYRELEQRAPHVLSRLVFLTGDTLSPEVHAFFAQVKRPYLIKPFHPQEVRQVIQQVLAAQ